MDVLLLEAATSKKDSKDLSTAKCGVLKGLDGMGVLKFCRNQMPSTGRTLHWHARPTATS